MCHGTFREVAPALHASECQLAVCTKLGQITHRQVQKEEGLYVPQRLGMVVWLDKAIRAHIPWQTAEEEMRQAKKQIKRLEKNRDRRGKKTESETTNRAPVRTALSRSGAGACCY